MDNIIHVRYRGMSHDILMPDLDLGNLSSDNDIRQAVAQYFEIDVSLLDAYLIEHHENGNVTVRPEAVFG